jgi:HupE/UreJ protein
LSASRAHVAVTEKSDLSSTAEAAPLTVDDSLILPWKRDGVLLSARWRGGASASRFFTARGGLITVELSSLQAGSGSFADAASRYTQLGIEHILFGVDHLLFILSLMLIVRSPWMLVKTITAFTIAHSITLGLATLGFVNVPSGPVEAGIALSIVFVAAEGLRNGAQGLALRRPWCVAFAFGLLHGFGFAGALSELGLPAREIPVALLFFNVGVEIGQIMFVAIVLGLRYGFGRLPLRLPSWTGAAQGYAIGTIAMMWFIERVGAVI